MMIGRSSMSGGFCGVTPDRLPLDFKKKRITIESIDEYGNIGKTYTVTEEEKDWLLTALWAIHGPMLYIRELDPQLFSEEELSVMEEVFHVTDHMYFPDPKENIVALRALFDKHSKQAISFALQISSRSSSGWWMSGYPFNVAPNNPYWMKRFSFYDALEFIEERAGIYYAEDKDGVKQFDFVDQPTKKQARYQRNKNGNRVVFLSFLDWKVYAVNESELK